MSAGPLGASKIFADHMVLQREKPIPVYGVGPVGSNVTVTFRAQSKTGIVAADGKWRVTLDAETAGGPNTLSITAPGSTSCIFTDVMVGEVWLCIGQSNMYMEAKLTDVAPLAAQAAAHPNIRIAGCTNTFQSSQQSDVSLYPLWSAPTAEQAGDFSAVGYGFARDVEAQLNVPIGLVRMAAGGVPIGIFMGPLSRDYDADVTAEVAASGYASQLYNGQIAPTVPFAIRGILYYQGEANQNSYFVYRRSLSALIREWRALWQDPALPVAVIQCAGWTGGNFHWIREAQAIVPQVLPSVGGIVSFDNAGKEGIHPTEKLAVAHRTADWALGTVYGQAGYDDKTTSYLKSFAVSGPEVTLTFSHTGGSLSASSGTVMQCFQLAGANGSYQPATSGSIVGDTIVLSANGVPNPVNVRYAFASAAAANLYNAGGHPLSPFRTDTGAIYGEPAGSDFSVPTAPGTLSLTPVINGSATLSWSAASDNSGVVEYLVYRDDRCIATTNGTSLVLTGSVAGQELYVRARDHAVNVSKKSSSLFVPSLPALQAWRQLHFATTIGAGEAADSYDADGDGIVNLVEYALGGKPKDANSAPAPILSISTAGTGRYLQLSFTRQALDAQFVIQGSNELVSWSDLASYPGAVAAPVTFTDDVDLLAKPHRFLRLEVLPQGL